MAALGAAAAPTSAKTNALLATPSNDDSMNGYDALCDAGQRSCGGGTGGGGTGGGGTGGGGTGGGSVIIGPRSPVISSILPSALVAAGATIYINGQNFRTSLSPDPGFTIPTACLMSDSMTVLLAQPQMTILPVQGSLPNFDDNLVYPAQIPANTPPGRYYLRMETFFGYSYARAIDVAAPVVSSFTPTMAWQGAQNLVTMTVTGTGFLPSSVLLLNGQEPAGVVYSNRSTTSLTATFSPATAFAAAGSLALRIGAAAGSSVQSPPAAQPFEVRSPDPVLSSLSPSPSNAEAGQVVTLTLTGSNIVTGAFVHVLSQAGAPVGTPIAVAGMTVLSQTATSLTVRFTAPAAGTYGIRIIQDVLETLRGASQSLPWTVTAPVPPSPTMTGITTQPTPAIAASPVTATVNGTNFVQGVSAVALSGPNGIISVTPTIVNGSQLTFGFTPPVAGTYTVTITNAGAAQPTAQGTVSVQAGQIAPTAPQITMTSPSTYSQGTVAGDLVVTLTGSNFTPQLSATVQVGTTTPQAVQLEYVSSTVLRIGIPQTLLSSQGVRTIRVTGSTGTASTQLTVTPSPFVFAITELSPSTLPLPQVMSENFITVRGTSFPPGLTLLFNGQAVSYSQFNGTPSASSLVFNARSSMMAGVGSYVVELRSPTGTSVQTMFAVTAGTNYNPQPKITSLVPARIDFGALLAAAAAQLPPAQAAQAALPTNVERRGAGDGDDAEVGGNAGADTGGVFVRRRLCKPLCEFAHDGTARRRLWNRLCGECTARNRAAAGARDGAVGRVLDV
jgi:hypothetical protein